MFKALRVYAAIVVLALVAGICAPSGAVPVLPFPATMPLYMCNDDAQNGGSNVPAASIWQFCGIAFSQTNSSVGGITGNRFKAYQDANAGLSIGYTRPLYMQYGNTRQLADDIDCGGSADTAGADVVWYQVAGEAAVPASPYPASTDTPIPENQAAIHTLQAPPIAISSRLSKNAASCNPTIPKYFPNSLNPTVRKLQWMLFRQWYNGPTVMAAIDSADIWHIDSSNTLFNCNTGNGTSAYEDGAQTDPAQGNPDIMAGYQALNLIMVRGTSSTASSLFSYQAGQPVPLELNQQQCMQASWNVAPAANAYAIGPYGDPQLWGSESELTLNVKNCNCLSMNQLAFAMNTLSVQDAVGVHHRVRFKQSPLLPFSADGQCPCTPIGIVDISGTIANGNTISAVLDGTTVTYTESGVDTLATTATALAAAINANGTVNVFAKAAVNGTGSNGDVYIRAIGTGVHILTSASTGTTNNDYEDFYQDGESYEVLGQLSNPSLMVFDLNIAADDTNTTETWPIAGGNAQITAVLATNPLITWGAYNVTPQSGVGNRQSGCNSDLGTRGLADYLVAGTCAQAAHAAGGLNLGLYCRPVGDIKIWGADKGIGAFCFNATQAAITIACANTINNNQANTSFPTTGYGQVVGWTGGSLAPGTGTYYAAGTPSNVTFTAFACGTGSASIPSRTGWILVQHA